MNLRQLTSAVAVVSFLAFTGQASAADLQIIGTWKLISGKYNGEERSLAGTNTMLKHITPEQIQWVMYDRNGKVVEVAGGFYSLKGNEFTEVFSYGLGPNYEVIAGKSHVFRDRVEGNRW